MTVYVVLFEPRNTDSTMEGFHKREDAVKRAAEIAYEYTDERDVALAYEKGNYEEAIELFVEECAEGADHAIGIFKVPVK